LPSRDIANVSATPTTTGTNQQPPEHADGLTGGPAGATWERLESQIEWYDKQARSSQRWFKVLKVAQIVVAAAIPVVAAAGGTAAVAGAMGAVVVIVEGLQQLFQFQQNWTSYRSTCETLKHEKFLFLAGAEPYSGSDREQLLGARVEAVVSQETSGWAAQQRQVQADAGPGATKS
jgi:hypothetical protein